DGKFPEPVLALTFPYADPRRPTLDEIAKEINGYDLTTGKRLATFAGLKDDGSTSAGDWIYTGHYPETGNLTKRRDGIQNPAKNDPTGMGFYPGWAWSWPLNRRVLYNRASADAQGRPWDPKRPGIRWHPTAAKWVGDVPDYPPTADPTKPGAPLPFIMTGEGTGRLFSNGVADGPFPEHYEPVESPIDNPLHPSVSATPVAFLYDKAAGRPNRFGTSAEYPYVATSYRLTEHEHYITQQVEHLVQLQPEAFVEIPAELAREKGIEPVGGPPPAGGGPARTPPVRDRGAGRVPRPARRLGGRLAAHPRRPAAAPAARVLGRRAGTAQGGEGNRGDGPRTTRRGQPRSG